MTRGPLTGRRWRPCSETVLRNVGLSTAPHERTDPATAPQRSALATLDHVGSA
jgi:hypothetical protein